MIEVCIGSACHLKGSYKVVQRFKELIELNKVTETVELRSSFCLGACGKGVSIRLNEDQLFTIDVDDVDEFFNEHILGSL